MSSFTDPDSPEFLAKIEGLRSGILEITEVSRAYGRDALAETLEKQ